MVQALPRVLDLKTKDVRARLGNGDDLPSVGDVQRLIATRITPVLRRHINEARERFRARSARLDRRKEDMIRLHREARARLDEQQADEWRAETIARAARLPKGLRGLWQRITGQYQATRARNESEARGTQVRHGVERQGLIDIHHEERDVLQVAIIALRQKQAVQLRELRKDAGGCLAFNRRLAAGDL